MNGEHPAERESLFSVTPARRPAYLIAFILLSLAGYGVVSWPHVADGIGVFGAGASAGDVSAAATAESVMLGFAIAHAAALGLALTAAEITGGTMVIADWLREKWVTPLKERRRAEGRAEANSIWRDWNRRRMEAEEHGEPFSKPQPFSGEE